MTDGGPEAPPLEFPSAEWRRVYDRLQGLLPRVEALAADRARLEEAIKLSDAREKSLHARLLQVNRDFLFFPLGFLFIYLFVWGFHK
jgi:hypothetical protein